MLNCNEKGASWTRWTDTARAAFLEKKIGSAEPFDFRVLVITAPVYRRWARVRLRDLQPWIETWSCPEMFAGAAAQVAQDATYVISTEMELCRLLAILFCGGAVDTSKFC